MRILVISHEYPPIGGGGANACFYLSREFVEQGNEVTIITADYFEHIEEDKTKQIIRLECIRKNKEQCSFFEMFDFICKTKFFLKTFMKRNKYDGCIVFFGIPSGLIGLYLKKKYGIPYIIRLGGGDIPGAQKRFKFIYKLIAPYLRLIWKNAHAIVANSRGLKERALRFEDRYPISIIFNGIDTTMFYPISKEKNLQKKEIVLLFTGRILEGKGIQDILPYLDEIVEKTDKTIKFLIVGDGKYRENLMHSACNLVNKCEIEFIGYIAKKSLYQYYQKADIFVFPSHSEGMPNVVLEAMACGLPIVVTPCEGSEELVVNNGYTVTSEKFVNVIIELIQNEDARIKMGNNSRIRVLKEFLWKSAAEQYIALFHEHN